ncbi:MAG: hypothetical protein R3C53_19890 [Pirellulaceae bacterium]
MSNLIVFLTKDLFFVPVLQSAAARQGVELTALFGLNSPKAAELDGGSVTACVIDLAGTDVPEIAGVVSELRSRYPAAQVAAFGPHVQTGRLDAAQAAGCDQVLTRGQLNNQLDRLIAAWSGQ